jgi:hypothetical protein
MDVLTLLSYGVVGYLISSDYQILPLAPIAVFISASVHKEIHHEQPLRCVLWFAVAMITLCAVVILFTGLHHATTLDRAAVRVETYHQPR